MNIIELFLSKTLFMLALSFDVADVCAYKQLIACYKLNLNVNLSNRM